MTESIGLHCTLLSIGTHRVGLWGGREGAFREKRLSIYDEGIGWTQVPFPGDPTPARLTMLGDGSILAVGVDDADPAWRWSPD